MSLFPQFGSGQVTSLPFRRELRFSTRLNTLPDFTEMRYADQQNVLGRWTVSLRLLPDADLNALAAFFAAQNGMYGRFKFLDPLENLLKFSEDFSQAVWSKTGGMSIVGGQADPLGGTAASLLSNTSGALNNLSQVVAAGPESQWFTGSVWVRASAPDTVYLEISDGAGQSANATLPIGTVWQRLALAKKFSSSSGGTLLWTIRLATGQALYLFGAQLMYLPQPGGYTKTTNSTGVHPVCRFDTGRFPHRASDFGVSDIELPIVEIAS